MLSRSRNLYALCIFLALIFCVLIAMRSRYFGNREVTGQIWYRPIPYPIDVQDINITVVKEKNVSVSELGALTLKSKDSKQRVQDFNGKVNKPVRPGRFRIIGGNKSGNSNRSSNCSRREVGLSKKTLPVTGLVSFPGSGNTWIRHLIQQMTGIGTSSVYCDGGLRARGFPQECERQRAKTIVVKTHEAKHFPTFKKIVLLVRNPYDALLSYANFARAGHTGHPSKQVLIQASNKMFNHSLRWYVNLTRNAIGKFKGPVHVLQYEKVKSDMASELRSLATFLNVNVSAHDIDCTVTSQEGNFHRQTSDAQHIDLLRAVYNKEKLHRLREAARTAETVIKDAYNLNLDLGGTVETILFQNS